MDEKQVQERLNELSKEIQELMSKSREQQGSNFVATSDDSVISSDYIDAYEKLLLEQRYYQKEALALENETIDKVVPYALKDKPVEEVEKPKVMPIEVVEVKERKIPFYMQSDDEIPSYNPPKEDITVEEEPEEIQTQEETSFVEQGPMLTKTLQAPVEYETVEPKVEISFDEPLEVTSATDALPTVLTQVNSEEFTKYVDKVILSDLRLNLPRENTASLVGGR